jgi:hypothetical protein
MEKFVFYNDTGAIIHIHPGTNISGVNCEIGAIRPLETRVFHLPIHTYPFVKMWDYDDLGMSILVQANQDKE